MARIEKENLPHPTETIGEIRLSKGEKATIRTGIQRELVQIRAIADPDVRRSALGDLDLIAPMVEAAMSDEAYAALSEAQQSVGIQRVERVIRGDDNPHILPQLLATVAYCDYYYRIGKMPPKFSELFIKRAFSISFESEFRRAILGGAALAPFQHRYASEERRPTLDALDEKLTSALSSHASARMKFAIQTAAAIIAVDLGADELRMQMPFIILKTGSDQESSESEPLIDGVPFSMMSLAEQCLTSDRKLRESVEQGLPLEPGKPLVRQIPGLLVGVRVRRFLQNARVIGLPHRSGMLFLRIRGFRFPSDVSAAQAFSASHQYRRELVLEHGSFAFLEFLAALRVSRAFYREKLSKTDSVNTIDDLINQRMDFMTEPLIADRHGSQSILSVAFAESQTIDRTKQWGLAEAQEHLRFMIRALVLRYESGNFDVRTDQQIIDLYRTHMLEESREFQRNELLELVTAMLFDTDHPVWETIQQNIDVGKWSIEEHNVLSEYKRQVLKGKPLRLIDVVDDTGLQDKLINLLHTHLELRCDTIRDAPVEQVEEKKARMVQEK